jgi:hypothetical protein
VGEWLNMGYTLSGLMSEVSRNTRQLVRISYKLSIGFFIELYDFFERLSYPEKPDNC